LDVHLAECGARGAAEPVVLAYLRARAEHDDISANFLQPLVPAAASLNSRWVACMRGILPRMHVPML
jgi:hypothetical protein